MGKKRHKSLEVEGKAMRELASTHSVNIPIDVEPDSQVATQFLGGPSPFSLLPLQGRAYCPRVPEVQSHKMAGAWDFLTHLLLFSNDLQRCVLVGLFPIVSSGNREGRLVGSRGQRDNGFSSNGGGVQTIGKSYIWHTMLRCH